MNNPNILIVLKWLPYPLSDGGRQAIYNAIVAMKSYANIYITYIKTSNEGKEVEFTKEMPDIHLVPFIQNTKQKKLPYRILSCIYSKFKNNNTENLTSINDIPNEYLVHINTIIEKYNIDIVQIEMMYNLSIVLSLPQKVKKIFIHHEIGFVRNKLLLDKIGWNANNKIKYELNKIIEIELLNRYDAVITLSDIDTKKLKAAGVNTKIYSSFAIISSPKSPNNNETDTSYRPILTFIGPSTHEPNVIGIHWFLEHCWSLLQSKDNSYKLQIIGKWSKFEQTKILEKYSAISFLGYVEDLQSAINNTTMIVPITIGSGIRMKLQEAAYNYIPFVSTTVGAEGLPFKDGINGFIEDDPNLFVEKILLLKDDQLRNKQVQSAYEIITNTFSINNLIKNRLSIIQEVLNN